MNRGDNRIAIGGALILILIVAALILALVLVGFDFGKSNTKDTGYRPVGSMTHKTSQTVTTTNPIAYGTHYILNSATSSMTA